MTFYLNLGEYLVLAEQALGIDATVLAKTSRIELAESALHAPAGEFGGHEFYPDLTDKAAVLVTHLTWNHPLPDGNKRSAWLALRAFVAINGGRWSDLDPAAVEQFMVAIGAHDYDENDTAHWLRIRIQWPAT